MKDTEFAYAVARVRSNETKLLSSSVIDTLISASDYEESIKILSDSGYDDVASGNEDKALSRVVSAAFELIYTSAPDKKCLDFLIVRNDFHNIKAILKCMVSGKNDDGMLLSPSVVDPFLIKKSLETRDYSYIPENVGAIVSEAYELVTTTMDGQLLEVFLDRKCLEETVRLAMLSKDEFSISLAKLMCTLSDIKIALRCMKTGKNREFFKNALAECDGIDLDRLTDSALEGTEALCSYVKLLGFEELSECIKKGYAPFEKKCDDLLIEKVRHAKYHCLGIAPLVAYYFAVDAEVKTVRIVLSCKKNGVDSESIRERVRELYV